MPSDNEPGVPIELQPDPIMGKVRMWTGEIPTPAALGDIETRRTVLFLTYYYEEDKLDLKVRIDVASVVPGGEDRIHPFNEPVHINEGAALKAALRAIADAPDPFGEPAKDNLRRKAEYQARVNEEVRLRYDRKEATGR
ncbi:MAG: hypothetical protein ACKVT1_01230 [Dehalococcoidia bacterium]